MGEPVNERLAIAFTSVSSNASKCRHFWNLITTPHLSISLARLQASCPYFSIIEKAYLYYVMYCHLCYKIQ
jgi:hypothetical protein